MREKNLKVSSQQTKFRQGKFYMNHSRPIWRCLTPYKNKHKSHATMARKLTKINLVAASKPALTSDSFWTTKNKYYKFCFDFSHGELCRREQDLKVEKKHVLAYLWATLPKSKHLTLITVVRSNHSLLKCLNFCHFLFQFNFKNISVRNTFFGPGNPYNSFANSIENSLP